MLAMTSITLAKITLRLFCLIDLGYAQFRKIARITLLISWPFYWLLTTDSQSGANAMG